MNAILRTTFASAFAIASITGASMAFAADNGGKSVNDGKNTSQTMGKKAKSNKCAPGNKKTSKGAKANCTM